MSFAPKEPQNLTKFRVRTQPPQADYTIKGVTINSRLSTSSGVM